MINKYDVKMPVQRDDAKIEGKEEEVQRLLESVSAIENQYKEQKLRLNDDHYKRFRWFGGNTDRSYFSYQGEAVYDFLFKLSKSGILSDQVGMGKTIEAGMIISELASRNEIRSLLIIVPNEMMAKKWTTELDEKFGLKGFTIDDAQNGPRTKFPGVQSIGNFYDFGKCVFECVAQERFQDFVNLSFALKSVTSKGPQETALEGIERLVKQDISEAVKLINAGLENVWKDIRLQDKEHQTAPRLTFDAVQNQFKLVGTDLSCKYTFDANGKIKDAYGMTGERFERLKNDEYFLNDYKTQFLPEELSGLKALVGQYFTGFPQIISSAAVNMAKKYPFLIIPISYAEGRKTELFLNRPLLSQLQGYRHKFSMFDEQGELQDYSEEYRVIDFFIDVGYQTLIVDEVHDYIDVCAHTKRESFHSNNNSEATTYPPNEFNRFELFDDYYFIRKSSLYKKLKDLADRANRKIFLTATPIKSDMVDFYLLTLLASNKDSEAYKKIRDDLNHEYDAEEREEVIDRLHKAFKSCIAPSAQHFCDNDEFMKKELDENGGETERFLYPYFNNEYLLRNSASGISDYLLSHTTYMTMEEIILELILAYFAEDKESARLDTSGAIEKLIRLFRSPAPRPEERALRTRIIFRAILNNTIKMRFEEDFTGIKIYAEEGADLKDFPEEEIHDNTHRRFAWKRKKDYPNLEVLTKKYGKDKVVAYPIERISQLLELSQGPRLWFENYRKYGIRHTRHQTYQLTNRPELKKFTTDPERYENLPIWPKRNGKVIYLVRNDVFFDIFINVQRTRETPKEKPIHMEDLPNFERLTGTPEEREEHFKDAVNIFNYVNNSMSGGDPNTHAPQISRYESLTIDDSNMVDFKLALVSRLMAGTEEGDLGNVTNKVLLFAEHDRDKIAEWFRYRQCEPIYQRDVELDKNLLEEYRGKNGKWERYKIGDIEKTWKVSESTDDLRKCKNNLLIIIDPKRYEKGIDLQQADTIINFDISYDPLKMEQRIGRIDRIRPSGASQEINIVSFVPYNDMSGFIINFFANEMKMFTQWMGETTGIVSVPDDIGLVGGDGRDVSFEGHILSLEKYYKCIYGLCKGKIRPVDLNFAPNASVKPTDMKERDISQGDVKLMAYEFMKRFGKSPDMENTSVQEVELDLDFLHVLRDNFDEAFQNSLSSLGEGIEVSADGQRVMRFNSYYTPTMSCPASSCKKCNYYQFCSTGSDGNAQAAGKKWNIFKNFEAGVQAFFSRAVSYYQGKGVSYRNDQGVIFTSTKQREKLLAIVDARTKAVQAVENQVTKALNAIKGQASDGPFTITFDNFRKIFEPMKKLYWDDVANRYIQLILTEFYNQCDKVLQNASLFERFIKTCSIAEFMTNMEGRANGG